MLVSTWFVCRREPAPGKLVALLVEEYITFIEGRPGYMVDSGSEVNIQVVHQHLWLPYNYITLPLNMCLYYTSSVISCQ